MRMKSPDPAFADYISKLEVTTTEIQNLIAETQFTRTSVFRNPNGRNRKNL